MKMDVVDMDNAQFTICVCAIEIGKQMIAVNVSINSITLSDLVLF